MRHESGCGNSEAARNKIIHSLSKSENGELLVKISDAAIGSVEAGVSRSEATRTGIRSFDAALSAIQAVRVERVFPLDRKAGGGGTGFPDCIAGIRCRSVRTCRWMKRLPDWPMSMKLPWFNTMISWSEVLGRVGNRPVRRGLEFGP